MSYQPPPVTPGYTQQPPPGDWAPPPRRGVHPLVWVTLVVALIAIGAVAYLLWGRPTVRVNLEPSIDGTPLGSIQAAQDAMPACKDVFVPGKAIDDAQAKAGCNNPNGAFQILGYWNCTGGKRLYTVDADTGAPRGWGFGGEKFHASKGEVAADPGYSKAMDVCKP